MNSEPFTLRFEPHPSGMWFVTSKEHPDMFVAATTLDGAIDALQRTIGPHVLKS